MRLSRLILPLFTVLSSSSFGFSVSGPVNPPPAGLWQPPTSLPIASNYIYLESQSGDPVGSGLSYLYLPSNSTLTFAQTGNQLEVAVQGNWTGVFVGMESLAELMVGYYGGLGLYPSGYNPGVGGLQWESLIWYTPCLNVVGWFVIDGITYKQGNMTSLRMRFAQRCNGNGPTLFGAFFWKSTLSLAEGPIYPVPEHLWEPANVPEVGDYVYLSSGVSQGMLYTAANAYITISEELGILAVEIHSNPIHWKGYFATMLSAPTLEAGFYGPLTQYPDYSLSAGGMNWSGNTHNCEQFSDFGWFAVDSSSYRDEELVAVTLRFEVNCVGLEQLRGAVKWTKQWAQRASLD